MRAYSHLSEQERDLIAAHRAAGRSLGAIARQLGRAKTTISRELRRNALPSGGYSPLHAAGAYIWRRRRAALIEKDVRLQTFVVDRLAEGWSPEQIAGWLKSGAERGLRAIGCQTIYASSTARVKRPLSSGDISRAGANVVVRCAAARPAI
ncbi:MAG: IS30 family transposase [Hyphomicrobiales bacterium]|nr:MAG: IS30 family transposase [Hyphomicrobiales bacterium]